MAFVVVTLPLKTLHFKIIKCKPLFQIKAMHKYLSNIFFSISTGLTVIKKSLKMPMKPQIERQTNEKRKQHTTIYKTVHKKLKIGQCDHH